VNQSALHTGAVWIRIPARPYKLNLVLVRLISLSEASIEPTRRPQMTRNRISLLTLASFLLALGLGATANEQYLISTKAGFVNRVEGKVHILRADSEDGEKGRASLGTQMRDGDRLSTTAKSFAETLLNPGSYLRLNENTEIRAASIDFNSVRFE